VTVSVLEVLPERSYQLKEADLELFTTKDSGPGGQHRNKTESCVIIRHKPTGIEAKAASKSQHDNRRTARAVLEARVAEFYRSREAAQRYHERREQRGSGMRGDKVRTYRMQDEIVTDHRTEKKCKLRDILAGKLEVLN
jgi:peptide chain release factor 1